MSHILGFVSQKGGVGKTTSTINVARYLAEFGKRVLLVDLDPQGNASSGLGIEKEGIERNLYHAMIMGAPPQEIIYATDTEGLHIIPAAQDLAGAEIEMIHLDGREFRLHNVLRVLRPHYDYILIDSPPSLGLLTINGLVASDGVIVPVQTEYYELEGLLEYPGTNLSDILLLLSDRNYRKIVIPFIRNKQVKDFWLSEYDRYPERFRIEAIAPIQNKVGAFLSHPLLQRILTKPEQPLSLRRIMDEGKILLVNLAKGSLGEDTSNLLGSRLISRFDLAALSRADNLGTRATRLRSLSG